MSIFGMSYGLMTDLGLKVNSETILSLRQDGLFHFYILQLSPLASRLSPITHFLIKFLAFLAYVHFLL